MYYYRSVYRDLEHSVALEDEKREQTAEPEKGNFNNSFALNLSKLSKLTKDTLRYKRERKYMRKSSKKEELNVVVDDFD